MSTQSGITASNELLQTFSNFQDDFLIIKINDESTELIPDSEAPKTKENLESKFTTLQSYIKSIHPQPVYIMLTIESEPRNYAFISFIPDVAHIRDKMLYASTKNTLLQALGTNTIKKDHIFAWSELEEIDLHHFKSIQPDKESQGLTEEEKLSKLDTLESVQSGFSRPLASMSGNQLLFNFDDNLTHEINSPKHKLIVFNIGANETFKLIKILNNVGTESLISSLDSIAEEVTTPRFILYNYNEDNYSLIYSCPSGSKVRDRMIYASNKQGLVSYLKTKLNVDKVLEVGDIEELDIHELMPIDDSKVSNSGLKFNKPKGPRRR